MVSFCSLSRLWVCSLIRHFPEQYDEMLWLIMCVYFKCVIVFMSLWRLKSSKSDWIKMISSLKERHSCSRCVWLESNSLHIAKFCSGSSSSPYIHKNSHTHDLCKNSYQSFSMASVFFCTSPQLPLPLTAHRNLQSSKIEPLWDLKCKHFNV